MSEKVQSLKFKVQSWKRFQRVKSMKYCLSFLIFNFSLLISSYAQPKDISSSEILHRMEGLKTTATVLYIAAHPDDENTRLISYLTKGKHYRVAYLSLTRGEGGQNLIGTEQGVDLGILRTQELLAARKVDGGEQFFSTAYDFGYSKTPVETMKKWGREKIVADVMNVMNNLQPDIVICRFPTTGEGGHGHHTASAMLAEQAFDSLVKINGSFVPKKLFWNTFNFGTTNTTREDQLKIDVGGFNTLLGKSYGEIAAEARSMHRCQAFGSEKRRGEQFEYFKALIGEQPKTDLMEGIVTDWSRFKGGDLINKKIEVIIKGFKVNDPSSSVKDLLILRKQIETLAKDNGNAKIIAKRLSELDELILDCSGIYFEFTNKNSSLICGDSLRMKYYAINRSSVSASLVSLKGNQLGELKIKNLDLKPNVLSTEQVITFLPNEFLNITTPYPVYSEKLNYKNSNLKVNKAKTESVDLFLPEIRPEIELEVEVKINDQIINVKRLLQYKYIDPSFGEIFQPVVVSPLGTVEFDKDLYITKNDSIKVGVNFKGTKWVTDFEIKLESKFLSGIDIGGKPSLTILPSIFPGGFCKDKTLQHCEFNSKLISYKIPFKDSIFTNYLSSHEINYDHIPLQTIYSGSQAVIVYDHFKTHAKKIGYIEGAGDKVPEVLKQLGYEVVLLTEMNLPTFELSNLDCIVTGVRAYNTQKWLGDYNDKFLKYVEDGGNFLIQYNTSNGLVSEIFQPFKLKLSRDRVTEEESKVTILDSTVTILNYPNKIREIDFDNWVQEYGLYFPIPDDLNFLNLFSMNDTGESPNKNSTIYGQFGKGKYVYTGLSFFRELPAGVPGAIKLFINLMEDNEEIKKEQLINNNDLDEKTKNSKRKTKNEK
jgi:LmbE family N-acetylglucosaminyl deacetylase